MNYLIIIVLACCATAARAQGTTMPVKPADLKLYSRPDPYIIDTTTIKRLNEKFYTGLARQDRMPVLLPYGTGKPIANAGKGMNRTDRMPNLWNKPQPDSTAPGQHFYKRPLYYSQAPSLSDLHNGRSNRPH
ncbi:hypothetical protein LL912_03835 [Niabella sp. CC-SYL272]|uniref:hypothetical protein n=1 Tax=Niabella agricola TaxID=2891571 RepID=UPI001F21A67F|nr:hypothetical protein [Niabella agricola]MCF3107901.1 hypothetical protein [Niabella agricola]